MTEPEASPNAEDLYHAALERAPDERGAFLDEACRGDTALRREVQSLLGYADQARRLLDEPVAGAETQRLAALRGSRVGPYEVLDLIGAGGMGEVYRARDARLGREVALKVLPATFAQDRERLARFEREARVLAGLSHPGIATLYGLEERDGVPFLAMELLDGETLAARLERGAIPIPEALAIFGQVAAALEAAHDQGVIHRDLKPANVQLTQEGQARLLDFGLAKAFAGDAPGRDPETSPTVSAVGTREGSILGTAAYMSPEQARGQALDERSDIWSFGCVLYEALTGRRPFRGDTVTDTLAAVLGSEVEWSALPEATPPALRRLLRRCLQKEGSRRLRHIADARMEIEEALDELSGSPPVRSGAAPRAEAPRSRWLVPALGLVLVSLAGVAGWSLRPGADPANVARFTIHLAENPSGGTRLAHSPLGNKLAIAPDGSRLAYFAEDASGPRRLYVRELDAFESRPLPGTERGVSPFFSPDGRWVAYAVGETVFRVSVDGGPPLEVGRANLMQGTWGPDGRIVVSTGSGRVRELSASGGEAKALPDLEAEGGSVISQFLPGGELLVSARPNWSSEVGAVSIETGERRHLSPVGSGFGVRLLRSGHLVWSEPGALLAVRLDPGGGGPIGAPVAVLDGLHVEAGWIPYMALSDNGTLVFAPSPDRAEQELTWVDREGRATPVPGGRAELIGDVSFSPDGREAAVDLREGRDRHIWVLDLERGTRRRLTEEGENRSPRWSPDDAWIAFQSNRDGIEGVFRRPSDGSGEAALLVERPNRVFPVAWSPDGRQLALREGLTLWVHTLGGETVPVEIGSGRAMLPAFSPDWRWVAFMSLEPGQGGVYVQPYPGPGAVTVVSSGGGLPFWGPSGRELFYVEGSQRRLMAVSLDTTTPRLEVGRPRLLFEGPYTGSATASPDGERFLRKRAADPLTELRVVLNWTQELERLVP